MFSGKKVSPFKATPLRPLLPEFTTLNRRRLVKKQMLLFFANKSSAASGAPNLETHVRREVRPPRSDACARMAEARGTPGGSQPFRHSNLYLPFHRFQHQEMVKI
ncbi:hypothetical protein CDAR_514251 [Caerostris darwini]|uniref:Uncharacterized protein n=1 Tax=Caerostris darwini TaxID=1538125 RepID=A0AAV4UND4_9ARAC|nr:hypothetical protein CDAR_514251 [Caerostris darwini]